MIILDVEQGTEAWTNARIGIPTSSNFHRIVTPTGTISSQRTAYMHRLLAEWISGQPEPSFQSDSMSRGYLTQPKARSWYEFQTDNTVEQVGFVYKDERKLVGCSPDGLIKDDRGLEIKCREGTAHVAFLLDPQIKKEIPQVQGSLWVTGLDKWDFVAYSEGLPSAMITVERDEEYISFLGEQVELFIADMLKAREYLAEKYELEMA